MNDPVWVLEVDRVGVVLDVTLVVPRRVYRRAEEGLIVELTCEGPVPAVGDRLAVLPSSDDDRNTHSLCDTDRQPR
jgi:hypothetical protein